MELRNEIFIHVYDWLCHNRGVKGQLDLAQRTKISKNTITNILKGNTKVSDSTLRKLNEGFGGIFNMRYLRGQDPYHMTVEDLEGDTLTNIAPYVPKGVHQEQSDVPINPNAPASLDAGVEHLLNLAGQIIKENEVLRRELQERIQELNAAIKELKKMTPKKYDESSKKVIVVAENQ